MMNTIDTILTELASGKKISEALCNVYSKRNVAIPYSEKLLNVDVRDLDMSARVVNALMRAHLFTLNDVIRFVEQGHKLSEVRHMGEGSCVNLMETILDYMWESMDVKERAEFLIDTVVRNEGYLKA
jgi:DNA-directed RNA polymerase alpha subunit